MEIINLNETQFNAFAAKINRAQFLQSFEWGEFQRAMGNEVFYLGLAEKEDILAAALLIKIKLPLGQNYLYCPRGPIVRGFIKGEDQREFDLLWRAIIKLAKEQKSAFVKFEPPVDYNDFDLDNNILGFKVKRTKFKQLPDTFILDLTLSEEELLNKMRQKTRYNLRLAEKKGVKIAAGNSPADYDYFWQMLSKTYSRKNIRTYSRDYYQKLLETAGVDLDHHERLSAKVYYAQYEGKILAANFAVFFGDTATYLHGGSDLEYRQLMAPYLLQWQMILEAKKAGFHYYDFFGVLPIKEFSSAEQVLRTGRLITDQHQSAGYSRFKRGFPGVEVNYAGTFDLVIKTWRYGVMKGIKWTKRRIKQKIEL